MQPGFPGMQMDSLGYAGACGAGFSGTARYVRTGLGQAAGKKRLCLNRTWRVLNTLAAEMARVPWASSL